MCAVMYLPRSSSAIDLQQQPHLHRTVRHPHNPRHARPLCVPPCPHSAVQMPNQIKRRMLNTAIVRRDSLEDCHVAGIVTGLTNSLLMRYSVFLLEQPNMSIGLTLCRHHHLQAGGKVSISGRVRQEVGGLYAGHKQCSTASAAVLCPSGLASSRFRRQWMRPCSRFVADVTHGFHAAGHCIERHALAANHSGNP
uniref:Uncharacterized protein n=1 Tax=Oryza barthii TaxID=65489 RepID=A0A0D3HT63_9ORYZ